MSSLTKISTRVVLVVYLAIAVGIIWRWLGMSSWAAGLDIASAGEQYTTWVEPLATLTGALLVSVPAVILIRMGWAWIDEHVLGNEPRRIPTRVG